MQIASLVRHARRAAGLSQRSLADAARMPQSTVARIELGQMSPRIDTADRLLRAAGYTLELTRRMGEGIDRSQIRDLLRLSPGERARLAAADAAAFAMIDAARR